MKKIYFSILALIVVMNLNAQTGFLDPSFMNGTGKTFTDLPNGNYTVRKVISMENSDVQVISEDNSGANTLLSIKRWTYGGTNNPIIGTDGLNQWTLPDNRTFAAATMIQSEMTLLVFNQNNSGTIRPVLMRYFQGGDIDPTLGTDGTLPINISNQNFKANYIYFSRFNGYYLIAGQIDNKDAVLIKLNSDFKLDTNFANKGIYRLNVFNNSIDEATCVDIDNFSNIYLAGNTSVGNGKIFLKKLSLNGISKDNFGEPDDEGLPKFELGTNPKVIDMKVTKDGKPTIIGNYTEGGLAKAFVMRVFSYGTKDIFYNGALGYRNINYGLENNVIAGFHLMNDQSVILGGYTYNATEKLFGIAKFYPDASSDPTFGNNGFNTVDISFANNIATATDITINGRFYIAGSGANEIHISRFNIAKLPFVRTEVPYEITSNSALSGGVIVTDGGATIIEAGVVWDTVETVDYFGNLGMDLTTSKIGKYTSFLTNLKPVTTYYVRAFARNQNGYAYGFPIQFKTLGPPKLTTALSRYTGKGTGLSGGDISSDGGAPITKRGIVWDTVKLPTITKNIGFTNNGQGLGSFSSTLTNLTIATTYFVRAYAENKVGIVYGNEATFTTSDFAIVRTEELIPLKDNEFIAGGNVISDGNAPITRRGIVAHKFPNPTLQFRSVVRFVPGTVGAFSTTISGFFPDSTYYLRAFAENDQGVVYGGEVTFTIYNGPSVTTLPITEIQDVTVKTGGNIKNTGLSEVTSRGVVWSLFPNPTIASNFGKTEDGKGSGTFESNPENLSPETFYYLRAYSQYNNAIGYGNEFTFWSLSLEPREYPSSFYIDKPNATTFRLKFNPAKELTNCDGYLIVERKNEDPDFKPNDATSYFRNQIVGQNRIVDVITNIDASIYEIDGLQLDTTYHYKIYPYNSNGINQETINYKSNGVTPVAKRTMNTSILTEVKYVDFSVNPNPVNKELKFDLPVKLNNAKMLITSATGELLSSFNLNDLYQGAESYLCDVSQLQSGTYFILINSVNHNYKAKFIVIK
jgi:hypothetical protein